MCTIVETPQGDFSLTSAVGESTSVSARNCAVLAYFCVQNPSGSAHKFAFPRERVSVCGAAG